MGKHSNIGLYCQLYYILLKDYWHFFYLNRTLFASNSNTSRKLTIFWWKKYALKIFLILSLIHFDTHWVCWCYGIHTMLHPEAVGNVWSSQCGLSDIRVFSQNAVNSGGVPGHLFLQPPLVIPSAIKVEGHCTGRGLQGHSISTWVPVQLVFRFPIPVTSLRYEDNCDKFFNYTNNKNTERGECIDQVKVPSYFNTLWWADCGTVELPHVKSQSTN